MSAYRADNLGLTSPYLIPELLHTLTRTPRPCHPLVSPAAISHFITRSEMSRLGDTGERNKIIKIMYLIMSPVFLSSADTCCAVSFPRNVPPISAALTYSSTRCRGYRLEMVKFIKLCIITLLTQAEMFTAAG